jgi:hypothetical protein
MQVNEYFHCVYSNSNVAENIEFKNLDLHKASNIAANMIVNSAKPSISEENIQQTWALRILP